ncbi:MAG: aminomethyl-transferring glycine dehydrogenase subunit GcvPB, partial [Halobacteriovoraceae bacterium]|nr:aminomethyl-transferring glycine dehydrogenase subunit GcvPB [Halobacteriovoraceae bacterium]
MSQVPTYPYDLNSLDRESCQYYIKANENDITEILNELGIDSLKDVYSHIDQDNKFPSPPALGQELAYEDLVKHVYMLSEKNEKLACFIGDGLPHYQIPKQVQELCSIRGLTTAYTPYQPERSQGTLQTLWIYQTYLSKLTGFEAINASLYERSTCLYEAIQCALRINRNKNKILVVDSLYPGDKEVLETLCQNTNLVIDYLPLDPDTACASQSELSKYFEENANKVAALAFSQVTSLGTLEDVDTLTDLARAHNCLSIALFDPMLISNNFLKPPAEYGQNAEGADLIVAEGQHLALDKNFGGPGLGIFGVRYNDKVKNNIRSTPGRFVGKAQDIAGNPCKVMVLSTREQHIRREKATSNICSNQSFVATLAGANLLAWGDRGLTQKVQKSRENALYFLNEILDRKGIKLAFGTAFVNEVTLELAHSIEELISKSLKENIEIGINVSDRVAGQKSLLKIFFNDTQTKKEIDQLIQFFHKEFPETNGNERETFDLSEKYLRKNSVVLPQFSEEKILAYYKRLGSLNVSPDDGIYPLGSCTMKYNPYVNDFCASFKGFTQTHPQSHTDKVQGNLQLLYEIQEMFKTITGLSAVTTQPVAGAQGELVGLKLFQAYHRDRKEKRDIILIPTSAHGTNPATAAVAGYQIKNLTATSHGQIVLSELDSLIKEFGPRIAGIMVTNPNTAGIFESQFKKMSELIHQCGGLVYMDGANMNAIAGIVDLSKIGVDAVHNNLHKTWTIPHGGGGPGDAIVAVSDKLKDYLPGKQIELKNGKYLPTTAPKSIGSFHRHWGNFAHKVRCYTYLKALGGEGVAKMSSYAVLSARYIFKCLKGFYPTLPFQSENVPRMHEFIITLTPEMFARIESIGMPKAQIIARIGKLFLDFGFHAPTVAFPEVFGLMIEPTESFSKKELDTFIKAVIGISEILTQTPEVLLTAPHFTPIKKVD